MSLSQESTESRRAFWSRHVAGWRASGLSQKAYCAREGLRPSTLGWWRWNLSEGEKRRRAPAPRLVPVRLQAASSAGFELHLPGERHLHIANDFDEGALVRLLRVLERPA